jgi:hypothetical protein
MTRKHTDCLEGSRHSQSNTPHLDSKAGRITSAKTTSHSNHKKEMSKIGLARLLNIKSQTSYRDGIGGAS